MVVDGRGKQLRKFSLEYMTVMLLQKEGYPGMVSGYIHIFASLTLQPNYCLFQKILSEHSSAFKDISILVAADEGAVCFAKLIVGQAAAVLVRGTSIVGHNFEGFFILGSFSHELGWREYGSWPFRSFGFVGCERVAFNSIELFLAENESERLAPVHSFALEHLS